MKIEFGVLDVPYNARASYKQVGRRAGPRRIRTGATITTGQLSDILEHRYGIVNFFLNVHGEEVIGGLIEAEMLNAARPESGRGSRTDHLAKAIARGEQIFRNMLDNKELDGQVEGVPTMAAELGYRFGRKNAIGGRPSFVDTGLYRDSFRIQVEES